MWQNHCMAEICAGGQITFKMQNRVMKLFFLISCASQLLIGYPSKRQLNICTQFQNNFAIALTFSSSVIIDYFNQQCWVPKNCIKEKKHWIFPHPTYLLSKHRRIDKHVLTHTVTHCFMWKIRLQGATSCPASRQFLMKVSFAKRSFKIC